MFGLPSQCVHHNIVHPCKLSFSCWLQGGIHATGCGSNKWLFSCCVSENEIFSVSDYGLRNKNAMQQPNLKFYKKNILRRRTDDLNQQVNIIGWMCSVDSMYIIDECKHFSDRMWNIKNIRKHNTKANNWRTASLFCRISLASPYPNR